MSLKTMIGTTAVLTTLVVAGCGSATDISGSRGASLTKQNFGSAISSATSNARSVHMTADVALQGQHLTLSADESLSGGSLKDVAAVLTVNMSGLGSVEARVLSGVVYINAGALNLPGSSTKPWIKVDLTDPSNPVGAAFAKIGALNPAELMKTFAAVSTLTKLGTETVDGVQTTHYTVTVDTSKAATMFGIPPGGGMASMPKTLTSNVWVDGSSRPVKVTMSYSMGTMEMHFSKWGEPVNVVAPAASQVRDGF